MQDTARHVITNFQFAFRVTLSGAEVLTNNKRVAVDPGSRTSSQGETENGV